MSTNDVFKYHYALVSKIPDSFQHSRRIDQGVPVDLSHAIKQHNEYTEILRRLGMDVLELPHDERHPESVFVADMAVVINGTALICKPSSADKNKSRLGEVSLTKVKVLIESAAPITLLL